MDEVKRVRYFKHEFLDAEDFNDEQNYHCQMRHMHNRYFHTWGIGHGLEVNFTEGQEKGTETKVTVSPGTAVDGQGREIVLAISKTIDFKHPGYEAGKSYYVTMKWQEQPGLPSQQDELKRWEEVPHIDTIDTDEGFPKEPEITLVLTKITLKDNTLKDNRIIAGIDHSHRRYATLEVGDDTVTSAKIVKADGTSGQDTTRGEGIKTGHIQNLAVTGAKIAGNTINESKFDSATRNKLVTNGNNHDHAGGDGAKINHSELNLDGGPNPHDVKMSQLIDLTANGNIDANNNKVTNIKDPTQDKDAANKGYIDTKNNETKGYIDTKYNDNRNYISTVKANTLPITGGTVNGDIAVNGSVRGNISGALDEDLQLQTAGTTRITIKKSNGYVGIGGATDPKAFLDVQWGHNEDWTASLYNAGGDGKGLRIKAAAANKTPVLQLEDNYGNLRFVAQSNGNVGIGTPEPGAKLEIKADSTFITWYEAIRLGPSVHSAINHPGSGMMMGFHSEYATYRAICFIDTKMQTTIMKVRAGPTGGNVWITTIGQIGSDYAEYFESKDGEEIRPGNAAHLDNGKIRPARKGETPVGIISANPGIVGGVHIEWPKKYLRDQFGKQIMEEYKEETLVPKKEKVKKERQKVEKKKVKEKVKRTEVVMKKGKYYQVEVEETVEREIEEPVFKEVDLYDDVSKKKIGKHKVPVMETYEEEIDVLDDKGKPVMVGSGKFETKTRPKINPDYDETKEYIPREKRPEWNCVGLLGQLPLRKGQPVAPTWIKIKDISKDVELWLVK